MTYVPSGNPASGSQGLSAPIRAEFAAIGAAFTVFPRITTTGLFDTVFAQVGSFTFTLPSAPGTLAMVANVAAEATTRAAADALLAPKASPALTGVPIAPTAAPLTNTTQISTTAFTTAAVGVEATNRTTAIAVETTNRTTAIAVETTRAIAAEALAYNNIGRNLLHNALFNIQQRGTGPFTVQGYTLDRWFHFATTDTFSSGAAVILDAQRVAIGDEAAVFAYSNIFTGNAAAGAFNLVSQRIEKVRRLGGKTVTVSFWASCTAGALKLGVSIDQVFGTGGSPSSSVLSNGIAVTLSTTMARYSVTLAVPSTFGKTLGTNGDDFTQLDIWFSSGSTNATRAGSIGVQNGQVSIWGVQLEVGTTATLLEKPDPRYDLSNCQRFYQVGNMSLQGYGTTGAVLGATNPFPVPMRASPTMTPTFSLTNASSQALGVFNNAYFQYFAAVTATGQMVLGGTFTASADL